MSRELALVAALGDTCLIPLDALVAAIGRTRGSYVTQAGWLREWREAERAVERMTDIQRAARKLERLLVSQQGMPVTVAVMFDDLTADLRKMQERIAFHRRVRAKAKRAPKADEPMDKLVAALVDLYTRATGNRATFVTNPKTGEIGGQFLDFWLAATDADMFDGVPPTADALRNRMRRKGHVGGKNRDVGHFAKGASCGDPVVTSSGGGDGHQRADPGRGARGGGGRAAGGDPA